MNPPAMSTVSKVPKNQTMRNKATRSGRPSDS